jgi:hypothetical protein
MPTLHLHLLYHAIRSCGPLEYELVAYFRADQPLPGSCSDLAATLIEVAALPAHDGTAIGLTVKRPRLRIQGCRALLRQHIRPRSADCR